MSKQKTPAEIAKQNGWSAGNILRAREEKRDDVLFQITAVGYEIVLGRRMLGSKKMLGNEIQLSLCDEFIRWSRE